MGLYIRYLPGAKMDMGRNYTPLKERAVPRNLMVSYGGLLEKRIKREKALLKQRKDQTLEERADLLCAVIKGRIMRNRQYMPSRNPKYKKKGLLERLKAYF